jgi:hypothetical protein
VTLRPPREEDVEKVYEWDRDPELAAWNGRAPIQVSLSAARRDYLARWEDPSVKTFIIEAREGEAEDEPGEVIGLITLYDFRHEGCELGIKIGPKAPPSLTTSVCSASSRSTASQRSAMAPSLAASTTSATPRSSTSAGGTASGTMTPHQEAR